MSGFTLGQRVRFAEHLKRKTTYPVLGQRSPGDDKVWSGEAYPGKRNEGGEGIIIGKRTLSNGRNHYYGSDEPIEYKATEYFPAYLIVTSLRSKPVHVLPEHLTALDLPADDDEPTHKGWDSEHFGATGCDGSLHPEDCLGNTHQGAAQ